MPETTILCWRTTLPTKSRHVAVEDYKRWRDERESGKAKLATFVKERLRDRYIDPVEGMELEKKNSFAIMALSCLLIETVESFYRGWPKSPNSGLAFCGFFDRHPNLLPEFKGYAQHFYVNVRCGILHQGETMQRWILTRETGAPVFDPDSLAIHATKFNRILGSAIDQYSRTLDAAILCDEVWKNFVKKMHTTVKYCG